MRQHQATVLGIGLLVSVSLAGCVGDSTKSASDTPPSIPIATVGSDTGPPVVEGQPSPPPEAGEVQARGVALAVWQISNLYTGDFAGFAATPDVVPLTGDFNKDGRTDVALVKRSAGWGSMPVALSNGDGTWRVINIYSGAFAGWAAEPGWDGRPNAELLTGDFNGDGRTDVALLGRSFRREYPSDLLGKGGGPQEGWNTMPVAFANSDGTWRITNSDIGQEFPQWAALGFMPHVKSFTGDFNGDGLTDVALVNQAAGWKTMPVAYANGDGTWRITNRSSGAFAGYAATPGAELHTGDFNGDGRTDVALVNRALGWAYMPVAFANADGTWRVVLGGNGGALPVGPRRPVFRC